MRTFTFGDSPHSIGQIRFRGCAQTDVRRCKSRVDLDYSVFTAVWIVAEHYVDANVTSRRWQRSYAQSANAAARSANPVASGNSPPKY